LLILCMLLIFHKPEDPNILLLMFFKSYLYDCYFLTEFKKEDNKHIVEQ
jgi:hypothetical protein